MLEKFFNLLLLSKNFTREFSDSISSYDSFSQGSLSIYPFSNIYTLYITERIKNDTDIKQWVYKNSVLELWRNRPKNMEKIFEFSEDNSFKAFSFPYYCGKDIYHAQITIVNSLPSLKIRVRGDKKSYTLLYTYY